MIDVKILIIMYMLITVYHYVHWDCAMLWRILQDWLKEGIKCDPTN